jgi:hypothetical protein
MRGHFGNILTNVLVAVAENLLIEIEQSQAIYIISFLCRYFGDVDSLLGADVGIHKFAPGDGYVGKAFVVKQV